MGAELRRGCGAAGLWPAGRWVFAEGEGMGGGRGGFHAEQEGGGVEMYKRRARSFAAVCAWSGGLKVRNGDRRAIREDRNFGSH